MFGTVARVKVQPGKEQEFATVVDQWTAVRAAATGQVAGYLVKLDNRPGEYLAIGVFRDRETYDANAKDSTTDSWYRKMRETLVVDPEWNDGEVTQLAVLSGI
jgi:quinol monooxygenase YgiN